MHVTTVTKRLWRSRWEDASAKHPPLLQQSDYPELASRPFGSQKSSKIVRAARPIPHPIPNTIRLLVTIDRGYSTSRDGEDSRICQTSVWICKEQAFWLVSRVVLLYILIVRRGPAVSIL